jgi:hypothetical protein
MYRLWYYHGKQGWKPHPTEPANSSHKALHKKGKNDKRTHVHPNYWNENIKAVAPADNLMLFTVTIDDSTISPSSTMTVNLPTFCVHECNGSWVYRTSGSDYQMLYDNELALYPGIDCRDPSENCSGIQSPPQYFTICANGTTLGDGTMCCQSKPMPLPPQPLVFEPTRRKHCLLGGCLRGRRTMTPGCCP